MLLEALIARWHLAGVPLQSGASGEQIDSVEVALGAPLPEDIRAFYRRVDGMRDFAYDRYFVSVWPAARILAESYRRSGTDEHGAYQDLAFADVMIQSWHFWYRMRLGSRISIVNDWAHEELGFSEFLARYLSDPESLGLFLIGDAI